MVILQKSEHVEGPCWLDTKWCPLFHSQAYGGRISDKELRKRSKLLEKLEPGDSVMADRGFEIDDIVPSGVRVNIPPFLDKRPQLEPHEVTKTRRIATLRIHVERAIEWIKNFRF